MSWCWLNSLISTKQMQWGGYNAWGTIWWTLGQKEGHPTLLLSVFCVATWTHCTDEGPKLATRGGWMGADQNFSRNWSVGLYPENHHKPSNLGWESSYGLAISKQKALGRETEAIARKLPKQQLCWIRPVWPFAQTGQTGRAGIRNPRPIRPVAPRQPANKAPNGKSRANEV